MKGSLILKQEGMNGDLLSTLFFKRNILITTWGLFGASFTRIHFLYLLAGRAEWFTYTPKSKSFTNLLNLFQGNATPSLQLASVTMADSTDGDILSIAQTMRLIVPAGVKECKRKNEPITSHAQNELLPCTLSVLNFIE